MAEFWEFIKAVVTQWQALGTGGVITFAINWWERFRRPLSKKIYTILVGGMFLFLAFFLAWRDQKQAFQLAKEENTEIRRELREAKQIPRPQLEGIRFISESITQSPYPDTPYGIKIVVQTNIAIQPFGLKLKCNVPPKRGDVEFAMPQALNNMHKAIYQDGSNTFEYSFRSPAIIPENPLIFRLWSDQPIIACQKV